LNDDKTGMFHSRDIKNLQIELVSFMVEGEITQYFECNYHYCRPSIDLFGMFSIKGMAHTILDTEGLKD